MSKVLIHFFSGTGNTSDLVHKVSEGLEKSGNQCTLHRMDRPMTQAFRESILSYDLHLFCFPIYATAVPHLVRLYIKRLPRAQQVQAVILTTNGRISTRFRDGYQGWALHQGRLNLMGKGFDVFYSETLDYPHNVTIAGPPRNNKYNRIIIQMAESKLQHVIQDIDKRIRYHRKIFLLNFVWSVLFGILYDLMGRRAIGKLFSADTNCTSCGQCEAQCPAKAIQIKNGIPTWKWNCEGCLRCINLCPKHAIQLSLSRIILMAVLSKVVLDMTPIIKTIIAPMINNGLSGWIAFLIELTLLIVVYGVFDQFLLWLSKLPNLRRVLSWGHTALYEQYHLKK